MAMLRPFIVPLLGASLITLLACQARTIEESKSAETAQCTRCHGGEQNQTGAPPRMIGSDPSRAGAHSAHVEAGALAGALACSECHLDPRTDQSQHGNGKVDVSFGALARAGGASPAYDRSSGTCSNVYCHGGTATTSPVWTALDGAAVACGACHGTPGNPVPATHPSLAPGAATDITSCAACHGETVGSDGKIRVETGKHVNGQVDVRPEAKHPQGWASPSLHGAAAAQDVRACLACHAVKGEPHVTGVVCASCHDAFAGGKDWTVTCNTCHGDATDPSGAPPQDLAGNTATTALGVGAHRQHVRGSALAPAFDCSFCHPKPGTVLDATHLDGQVELTGYTGADGVWKTSAKDPGFAPASASCATAYCHGAFQNGNATNAPVWTRVGEGQADCGTCHGVPPPAPHPVVPADLAGCNACHPQTISATGALISPSSGGKHLDGAIEFSGGHEASWMDTTSSNFHANTAVRSLSSCKVCHGQNLDGSTGFGGSCGRCHDRPGQPWATNCTMCHGGTDNATGAPPKATWGRQADPVRTGAHTAHVTQGANGAVFDCSVCHVTPADALTPGHIDGETATVRFAGVAVPTGVTPTFDRATAGCASTYCHGATLSGGSKTSPVWTSTGTGQADCGTCHGVPPPADVHPPVSSNLAGCNPCHPDTVSASGAIVPRSAGGKHIDGTIQAASGHDADWMNTSSPKFHAYSANQGLASCQWCHGADLSGGSTGVSCASCHDGVNRPAWNSCVMCHGDKATGVAAPPRATWGNNVQSGTTNVRIGAHATHVKGTANSAPIDCAVCHPKPADALTPGHVDAATATVTFTGVATQGVTGTSWNRTTATCASTYCHGANGGSNPTPIWTKVGQGQATCGSCHGDPPNDGGLDRHVFHVNVLSIGCGACHATTSTQHVNGRRDVVLYTGTVINTGWTSQSSCDTLACHGAG